MAPTPSRQTLGQFLRARREQLDPESVGITRGLRRRAHGLRREEVAALAGISPTWYTWIEQGRTVSVSGQTLAALAAALRLSAAERSYLFRLASRADPTPAEAPHPDQMLLDQLLRVIRAPAYVLDRLWDAIAWNRPAAMHFDAWLRRDVTRPNLLRYVYTDPGARSFIEDWEERAERLVGEFRADTAGTADDPLRQALVQELSAASPLFRAAWASQRVLGREGGRRGFVHPRHGPCTFLQQTLRLANQPQLKVTVLMPYVGQSH